MNVLTPIGETARQIRITNARCGEVISLACGVFTRPPYLHLRAATIAIVRIGEHKMFGPNTYLIWLACFIGLPLGILLIRHGRVIWQQARGLAWVVAGSLVGGWAWDALAVRVGLWTYDPGHLVGWWALGLPLEEWLWIIGVALLFGSVTVVLAERAGLGHTPVDKER